MCLYEQFRTWYALLRARAASSLRAVFRYAELRMGADCDQNLGRFGAWTSLHKAVMDGDTSRLRSLLAQGANPNSGDLSGYCWTPLHLAAARQDQRAVALLFKFGAHPNVASMGGMGDTVGVTPLHEACEHGELSVAAVVRWSGARVFLTPSPVKESFTARPEKRLL